MAAFHLRAARLNAGLSPEQLGEQIHVSGRTIRRLEEGMTPFPATALKIAEYLGEPVTRLWPELMGEEVKPEEAA